MGQTVASLALLVASLALMVAALALMVAALALMVAPLAAILESCSRLYSVNKMTLIKQPVLLPFHAQRALIFGTPQRLFPSVKIVIFSRIAPMKFQNLF